MSWIDAVDYTTIRKGDVLFSISAEDISESTIMKIATASSEWINADLSVEGVLMAKNQIDITLESFTSYPNPMADYTNVEIVVSKDLPANLQLVDLAGRVYHRETLALTKGPNNMTLYPEQLGMAPGVYLLQLEVGLETRVIKLVYAR